MTLCGLKRIGIYTDCVNHPVHAISTACPNQGQHPKVEQLEWGDEKHWGHYDGSQWPEEHTETAQNVTFTQMAILILIRQTAVL